MHILALIICPCCTSVAAKQYPDKKLFDTRMGLFIIQIQDISRAFKEFKKGTQAATHMTSIVKSKETSLACLLVIPSIVLL